MAEGPGVAHDAWKKGTEYERDSQEQPGTSGNETTQTAVSPLAAMNVSPFLWKTFNLVSDPNTDHILSWSADGTTFTVWRPDLMERELLPKTFKHSNFASFVRQLNNYGFHKVHSDRYEFAVEGFQRGRPDLLQTLRRHDANRSHKRKQQQSINCASGSSNGNGQNEMQQSSQMELANMSGVANEIMNLKRDRLVLYEEVKRLHQQNARTQGEVERLRERLQNQEAVQQQVLQLLQHLNLGGTSSNYSMDTLPRKRNRLLIEDSPPTNLQLPTGNGDTERGLTLQLDSDDSQHQRQGGVAEMNEDAQSAEPQDARNVEGTMIPSSLLDGSGRALDSHYHKGEQQFGQNTAQGQHASDSMVQQPPSNSNFEQQPLSLERPLTVEEAMRECERDMSLQGIQPSPVPPDTSEAPAAMKQDNVDQMMNTKQQVNLDRQLSLDLVSSEDIQKIMEGLGNSPWNNDNTEWNQ